MAKKQKAVRSPMSKEEILGQMKQNSEFQKRMTFIKEKFWPTLCATADTIEDATMFLSGFNTALMQSFLGLMKEQKFKDMKLDEKIAGDYAKYKDIIQLFDEMDVFTAKDYIEGMKGEIELFRREEDRKRKLSDLKVRWIDEK